MIDALFNGTAIPVTEQMVNFSEARHNVLASNIANMDVPGYRTRDLSTDEFQANLKKAIERRDERQTPFSLAVHNYDKRYGDPFDRVRDDLKNLLYHDESDVAIEQQVNEVAKNQLEHNLALAIMVKQFSTLQAAISERA